MWEFSYIRERAIQELLTTGMAMPTIEKIECAKSFEVKGWLFDGYMELLKRDETITDDEAERLGWKTATKLVRLREQFLVTSKPTTPTLPTPCGNCGCSGYMNSVGYCQNCGHSNKFNVKPDREGHDFTEGVRKEFEAELL